MRGEITRMAAVIVCSDKDCVTHPVSVRKSCGRRLSLVATDEVREKWDGESLTPLRARTACHLPPSATFLHFSLLFVHRGDKATGMAAAATTIGRRGKPVTTTVRLLLSISCPVTWWPSSLFGLRISGRDPSWRVEDPHSWLLAASAKHSERPTETNLPLSWGYVTCDVLRQQQRTGSVKAKQLLRVNTLIRPRGNKATRKRKEKKKTKWNFQFQKKISPLQFS